MKQMKRIQLYLFLLVIIAGVSCKKYVDTPLPTNELVSELVFTNDKSATAAVTGVYSEMNSFNYFFSNILINYLTAMSADELYYYTTFANFDVFRNNALLPSSQYVSTMWSSPYSYIYNANSCIEGLTAASGLTPSLKSQLLGESYFLRAFMHFYLVNLYGNVPLITSTDYKVNGVKPRDTTTTVYNAIINDLKQAKQLMADDYPSASRVRPNKAAATALLARVYLYTGQWDAAEKEATEVITNNRYELLKDLNTVFLANSREAIWQLQAVNTASGRNTWEGFTATPATATSTPLYRLDSTLVKAFEATDKRKANWTGSRTLTSGATVSYPYKYKIRTNVGAAVTEYSMVMRLAEQYLVRAEARAQQTKLSDARADLDTLRHRAGLLSLSTTLDQQGVLTAVEQERRVELFTEWGHRWFDLKRTKRADVVIRAIKPTFWQAADTLMPIPTDAIKTNPFLKQNDGYPK
jgi:hypothetical protein